MTAEQSSNTPRLQISSLSNVLVNESSLLANLHCTWLQWQVVMAEAVASVQQDQ